MKYGPLREFVLRRGGFRLCARTAMTDRLLGIAVEEWPEDCPPEKAEEVLAARMRIRVKQEYGSIVALFIVSVLVNVISRLIVEWWRNRDAHRVLMAGWHRNAKKAS